MIFLFPRMKKTIKEKRLYEKRATIKEIKTEYLKELNNILKSAFQKYFEDWNKCWQMGIILKGSIKKMETNKLLEIKVWAALPKDV